MDATVAVAGLAFDPATQAALDALPVGQPVFARTALDATGSVGFHTSVTIGGDGLGLISYFDSTNGGLKVVHLSNHLGVPFHRAR